MTDACERRVGLQSAADEVDDNPALLSAPYRILLLDADPALLELIREWLADHGCRVVEGRSDAATECGNFDVVVVDMPFPRGRGLEIMASIKHNYPQMPVLALSAGFFAGVESAGAVARSLGVSRALPKPVTREALVSAVVNMLHVDRTGVAR